MCVICHVLPCTTLQNNSLGLWFMKFQQILSNFLWVLGKLSHIWYVWHQIIWNFLLGHSTLSWSGWWTAFVLSVHKTQLPISRMIWCLEQSLISLKGTIWAILYPSFRPWGIQFYSQYTCTSVSTYICTSDNFYWRFHVSEAFVCWIDLIFGLKHYENELNCVCLCKKIRPNHGFTELFTHQFYPEQ